jgi:hypothetical protein
LEADGLAKVLLLKVSLGQLEVGLGDLTGVGPEGLLVDLPDLEEERAGSLEVLEALVDVRHGYED